jgi:hypothetical protein
MKQGPLIGVIRSQGVVCRQHNILLAHLATKFIALGAIIRNPVNLLWMYVTIAVVIIQQLLLEIVEHFPAKALTF